MLKRNPLALLFFCVAVQLFNAIMSMEEKIDAKHESSIFIDNRGSDENNQSKSLDDFDFYQVNTLGGLPQELKFSIIYFSFANKTIFEISKLIKNIRLVNRDFKSICSDSFKYLKKILEQNLIGISFVPSDKYKKYLDILKESESYGIDFIKLLNGIAKYAAANRDQFGKEIFGACIYEDTKIKIDNFKALIFFIEDINNVKISNKKKSLLLKAIRIDDKIEFVELLLQAGADPNVKNCYGWTPLVLAITHDEIKIFKLFFPHDQNLYDLNIDALNGDLRFTALFFAAQRSLVMTETLLNLGADPNLVDKEGRTPLMYVLISNFISDKDANKMISLLFANEADPAKADDDGITPLMLAAIPVVITEEIGTRKRKISRGRFLPEKAELLRILLENEKCRSTINVQDRDGKSALMKAIAKSGGEERSQTVKILLQNGADVNLKDSKNQTALDIAKANNFEFPRQ